MPIIDELKKNQQQHMLCWNGDIANDLLLVALKGNEYISSPFCYGLRSLTQVAESELIRWHGKSVSCRIGDGSYQQPQRYLHGVITKISYTQRSQDDAECILTLEPSLSLLKLGREMGVWQNISVPDLVSKLFSEHGFAKPERQLIGDYPKREYYIQYRESVFDFIHRLLEEEGIYYFFRHSSSEHTLVLADHPGSHQQIKGNELSWHHQGKMMTPGTIDRWESASVLQPGNVLLQGFNLYQASAVSSEQSIANDIGGNVANITFTDITPLDDRETISRKAQYRMNTYESNICRFTGSANAHWLCCGEVFDFTGHPSGNKPYRIHELTLDVVNNFDEHSSRCQSQLEAISNEQPWSPPLREERFTRKQPGLLTALVVGPPSEEIHTDEFGRIKIQFPWDKLNPYDDTSSCWVPVAQLWAGSKFGAQFIPRVGSQVLVSFVQGHTDFPLVTGMIYNGQNKPPFSLPAEKNESGFMTRSSPKGDVDEGNRLSFSDMKGSELLTIVAQKDLSLTVKNNIKNMIAANRSTELTKGDERLTLKQGDLFIDLENGSMQQKIAGDATTEVNNGNFELNVVGGSGTVKTDKALIFESTQSLELKVGNNRISLSPSGISINGMMVSIEATGTVELKGAMATVSGTGMTQVSGGIINIG